ncbi:hypothetical protein LINPERHAP2_LOCUS26262 [Linum perenne]
MKSLTKSYSGHRPFILSSITFIIFFCILASFNQIRFDHLFNLGQCALSKFQPSIATTTTTLISSSSSIATSAVEDDEIRILMGILTLPDQYHKRHFLRMIYGTQQLPPGTKIDVKFVFCNLTKEDQKVLVALEIMRYDDIIILNCKENMNNDDDAYFRLGSLASSLRPLPRDDLYYGYVIPCPSMDPFVHYMSGMGYLVSWDIVEWIKDSDIPKMHKDGPEDKVFGEWIREGRRGRNRHNAKWSMYNFPVPPTGCTHELWPDTVAVHLLKTQEKWIQTLNYFNVTKDLKPSKLYHIP